MTLPQLLHALAAKPQRWYYASAKGHFLFVPSPAKLSLEPLDSGRHISKGKPQLKRQLERDGKVAVEVKNSPRPRYKLYLDGVPARVSDEHIHLLNKIGDQARSDVIDTALAELEKVLEQLVCYRGTCIGDGNMPRK